MTIWYILINCPLPSFIIHGMRRIRASLYRNMKPSCIVRSFNASFIPSIPLISQVNVATKASLWSSSQTLWIPEAHLCNKLLLTHPLCHTTKFSSSSGTELHRNGHWVNPLRLLLSLQPLREIKPTWVCFLSVRLPIWLSHDRNVCRISLCCGLFNAVPSVHIHFVVLAFGLSEPHVGSSQINQMRY